VTALFKAQRLSGWKQEDEILGLVGLRGFLPACDTLGIRLEVGYTMMSDCQWPLSLSL
jgi:hypothetical protein